MTKFTDLRGASLAPIHLGSVLLSKQEDLCSTSHNHHRNHQPATKFIKIFVIELNL